MKSISDDEGMDVERDLKICKDNDDKVMSTKVTMMEIMMATMMMMMATTIKTRTSMTII